MAKKEKDKGGLSLMIDPKDTVIKADDKTTVTVKITRDKFDDDVVIKFEDLPKGVTVEDGTKQTMSKGSSESLTL